jgi:hypothetical protein
VKALIPDNGGGDLVALHGAIRGRGQWVIVPAHRVFVLPQVELDAQYEYIIDKSSNLVCLFRRKSDGRMFRRPRFLSSSFDFGRYAAIEEVKETK